MRSLVAIVAALFVSAQAQCGAAVSIARNSDSGVISATSFSSSGAPSFCSLVSTGTWYSYTATMTETIVLSTCDSSTTADTYISVFSSCPTSSCITSNDDYFSCSNSFASRLTFSASTGTTYYIWLAAFGSTGNVRLSVTPGSSTPAPPSPPSTTYSTTGSYTTAFAPSSNPDAVSLGVGLGVGIGSALAIAAVIGGSVYVFWWKDRKAARDRRNRRDDYSEEEREASEDEAPKKKAKAKPARGGRGGRGGARGGAKGKAVAKKVGDAVPSGEVSADVAVSV